MKYIESGGTDKIGMWMLDTDYGGRSLFPKQVFFSMSGEKDGWAWAVSRNPADVKEIIADIVQV